MKASGELAVSGASLCWRIVDANGAVHVAPTPISCERDGFDAWKVEAIVVYACDGDARTALALWWRTTRHRDDPTGWREILAPGEQAREEAVEAVRKAALAEGREQAMNDYNRLLRLQGLDEP